MPKDLRHSLEFQSFMRELKWEVKFLDGNVIYLKKFPLFGYFAKMPRPSPVPPAKKINEFCKKNKIFRFNIAPAITTSDKNYLKIKTDFLKHGFKIDNWPFNPVTTYLIDLTKSEKGLFSSFSDSKRRGIKKANRNGIIVESSNDFKSFEWMRWKQFGPLGFMITHEMKYLYKSFFPKKSILLLAYQKKVPDDPKQIRVSPHYPLGGIFMIFHDKIAYYWYASAYKKGKKLQAPSLLIWEAFKLAKKKGCILFDFDGVADPRFPEASKSWLGFTKFKEGFNGSLIEYCENFTKGFSLAG